MTPDQILLYKQSLLSAVRKQESTCLGIRKNIKRLQDELTLELAALEGIHKDIDELGEVVEYSFN